MIIDFDSYIVLKAISIIQYEWEQSLMLEIEKGGKSADERIKVAAGDLHNGNLWNVYYNIPAERIEKIISNFIKRRMISSKTIRIGDNLYSMLYVTDKGKKILYRLDKKYCSTIYESTSNSDKGPYIIKDSCELVYNLREAIV